jgi:phosphatidylglycerophosphatase C
MDNIIPTNNKKTIAAFDFDGTITTSDTLPVFIWFAVAIKRIVTGSFLIIPFVALYKLRFIPNYKAKERMFKAFFANTAIDDFNKISNNFIGEIEKIINPLALKKLKWHQQMGHEVIIISASAENWIYPWASKNGINTVLATQLEVKNNKVTGSFLNKNCHGPEKVSRLLAHYPDRSSFILYAYGDSNGDKELLAIADHKFYRTFGDTE